jgi:radical SAM superfamily enzyme YgiQ (UPF0313 family)
MRVLLVYSNRSHDLIAAPPIGLAYVATATRAAGHDVRVLDLLLPRRPLPLLAAAVREHRPDVVGFSVRNIDNVVHQRLRPHLDELRGQIAVVRRQSSARIVLGGAAVSILGAKALDHADADAAVLGEGEVAFPALLAALESGRGMAGVAGVVCRDGTQATSAPLARLASFGASGLESWIDWRRYARRGAPWPIQSRRGCPQTCSYCAYPSIEGHASRLRPAGDVVDEIEAVARRMRPRAFEIVDSTFNVPEAHALAICEEIVRRGLTVTLSATGVTPLGTSRELFALMRRAGFRSMLITPEAGSDVMLENLHKGFRMEDVRRTAALVRESGIASAWFFLMGGPGETPATVEETVAFAERELSFRRCSTVFMTGIRVLPGTPLALAGRAAGWLPREEDLTEPVFYFSPDVSEKLILERINAAIRVNPCIVHAAEEGGSLWERIFDSSLYALGFAPPYIRYLSLLLRFPPMAAVRARFPPVTASRPAPGVRVVPAPA